MPSSPPDYKGQFQGFNTLNVARSQTWTLSWAKRTMKPDWGLRFRTAAMACSRVAFTPCLCSCNPPRLPTNVCGVPRGWQSQSPVRLVTGGMRPLIADLVVDPCLTFLALRRRELPSFFSPIFPCPEEVLCETIHWLHHQHDSIM